MKFNLWYNPYENKTLPKLKKIQQIRPIKTKNMYKKLNMYNKNRKTIVDFAMAHIGHHTPACQRSWAKFNFDKL